MAQRKKIHQAVMDTLFLLVGNIHCCFESTMSLVDNNANTDYNKFVKCDL